MASLGDTVAELVARARAGAAHALDEEPGLRRVTDFGSNPGALGMWLHVPEHLPAPAPLVVVLHGCGQTATGYAQAAGWLGLADRHGFVVLCPEQARSNNVNRCFNWFEPGDVRRDAGEAASIAQMVRKAIAELDLDPHRVFITGLSAGGAMAAAMLATHPELFAAGALIAGLPYGAAAGVAEALSAMRGVRKLSAEAWGGEVRRLGPAPRRWPRISVWHGDADTTVTPAAADAAVLQWRDLHGAAVCVQAPSLTERHSHTVWLDAEGAVAVEQHRISGLGHGAPIAAEGPEACGTPAPWLLDVGLSSSREIARSWGLLATAAPVAGTHGTTKPPETASTRPRRRVPSPDVGDAIAKALRQAGLLR